MKLPVGYSNFKAIIDNQLCYVDKTWMIKDILDDALVILITRPRRFGKTLNLSMLHYFFAAEAYGESTEGLFEGLHIMQAGETYLQHHRKYPVIFITFKDIKSHHFEDAYASFCSQIRDAYSEHYYLLAGGTLREHEKKTYLSILNKEASRTDTESSLKNLTEYLYRHWRVKPIVLIDEYDTPMQSGYIHHYYDDIVALFRTFLGIGLKDNPYLFKAVLTGILRISKESLFSGLNNLKVYSLLDSGYGAYFGFTQEEVNTLLELSGLTHQAEAIQDWYNGYQISRQMVYNPWSILYCLDEKGALMPYWINTSDNTLIKNLLIQSDTQFKQQFELLLDDKPVEKLIDTQFVYGDLAMQPSPAVWSLLLMAGYLKVVASERTDDGLQCALKIPNREVKNLYQQIIKQWLSNNQDVKWYNTFLMHLLTGQVEELTPYLSVIMQQTVSVHDVSKEPEAFYHGLLLGLVASIDRARYTLESNRESGQGFFDIRITPKDTTQPGIILELKRVILPKTKLDDEAIEVLLTQKAQEALQQIDARHYVAGLQQRGITRIIKLGIAFSGKQFKLIYEG